MARKKKNKTSGSGAGIFVLDDADLQKFHQRNAAYACGSVPLRTGSYRLSSMSLHQYQQAQTEALVNHYDSLHNTNHNASNELSFTHFDFFSAWAPQTHDVDATPSWTVPAIVELSDLKQTIYQDAPERFQGIPIETLVVVVNGKAIMPHRETSSLSGIPVILQSASRGQRLHVDLKDERQADLDRRTKKIDLTIGSLTGQVVSLHGLRDATDEISLFRARMIPLIKREMRNRKDGVYALAPDVCSAPLPVSMHERLVEHALVRFHYKNTWESKTMKWDLLTTAEETLAWLFENHRRILNKYQPIAEAADDALPTDYLLKCYGSADYYVGDTLLANFNSIRHCLMRHKHIHISVISREEAITQATDDIDEEDLIEDPHPDLLKDVKPEDVVAYANTDDLDTLTRVSMFETTGVRFSLNIVGVDNLVLYDPNTKQNRKTRKFLKLQDLVVYVEAGLYHGSQPLCEAVRTRPVLANAQPRWNQKLYFDIDAADIPRAARVCLTVFLVSEGDYEAGRTRRSPLAAINCSLIDYRAHLRQGPLLLSMWAFEEANPIASVQTNPDINACPTISLRFPSFLLPLFVPESIDDAEAAAAVLLSGPVTPSLAAQSEDGLSVPIVEAMATSSHSSPTDLSPLSTPSQATLGLRSRCATGTSRPGSISLSAPVPNDEEIDLVAHLIRQDSIYELDAREKAAIWRHRVWVRDSHPRALAKVVLSCPYNQHKAVAKCHALLDTWPPYEDPVDALELLDASIADAKVRAYAIDTLWRVSDDELSDFLIQLVQSLKNENFHDNPLARFLISRSLRSKRMGHTLFWCLKAEMHVPSCTQRFGLYLEAYLRGCGAHRDELMNQVLLTQQLVETAVHIKNVSNRTRGMLQDRLRTLRMDSKVQLVQNPSIEVRGLAIEKCKYMESKKLPLWLVFENADGQGENCYTIFKEGDDIRQDMLTLQMIRIMDKMWQQEDMDLRLKPYVAISTGDETGYIEVVLNSNTLANIQVEYGGGAIGAFKSTPLMLYLREHNPTEAEYQEAVENFIVSCAGYCVCTYILGIGDRHNDNIMLDQKGHLFHIDFGHFLGNIKTKFGISRERTPFVFTPDMSAVICSAEGDVVEDDDEEDDDPDQAAEKAKKKKDRLRENPSFIRFLDICCRAYNIIRHRSHIFINLFRMMLSTGIPELRRAEDIHYVRKVLQLDATDEEAAEYFRGLIDICIAKGWSKQLDWLVHNVVHSSSFLKKKI